MLLFNDFAKVMSDIGELTRWPAGVMTAQEVLETVDALPEAYFDQAWDPNNPLNDTRARIDNVDYALFREKAAGAITSKSLLHLRQLLVRQVADYKYALDLPVRNYRREICQFKLITDLVRHREGTQADPIPYIIFFQGIIRDAVTHQEDLIAQREAV